MKRVFLTLCIVVAGVGLASHAADQDAAASASAVADRQYSEERYKRLNSAVEDLQASQLILQKRISALVEELHSMREQQAKSAQNYPSREDLKKLWERIQELDRKREEDKKLILEEIRKLAVTPAPSPEPVEKKNSLPEPAPAGPQKVYEYEVKPGDTIAAIVAAYQQNGIKVTLDQVLKANPNLKPKSLRPRQKVIIPVPE